MRFFKIIVPFVLMSVALSACGDKPSVCESFIGSHDALVRGEGRIYVTDSSLRFDYPGTRFAIDVEGEGRIYAALKPNAGYFTLFVDGKEKSQISTYDVPADGLESKSDGKLFFLDSLSGGKHQLELILKSEGLFCKPEFFGFQSKGNFRFYPLERRSKRFEFIGNSITCAYGVEAPDETWTFNDSTSNFTCSYAFLTASAFDAELMVVARSGIGVYRNYNDDPQGSARPMPVVYRNVLISEEDSKWDFASAQEPDLLCINLGTNDLSTVGFRWDLFDLAYRNFLTEVRGYYPNAKILLLAGCMLPAGPVWEEYCSRLNAIAEDWKKKGDDKIYRCDFEPHNGSLGYGADWHPSKAQQQKMAQTLIPVVQSILNE